MKRSELKQLIRETLNEGKINESMRGRVYGLFDEIDEIIDKSNLNMGKVNNFKETLQKIRVELARAF